MQEYPQLETIRVKLSHDLMGDNTKGKKLWIVFYGKYHLFTPMIRILLKMVDMWDVLKYMILYNNERQNNLQCFEREREREREEVFKLKRSV